MSKATPPKRHVNRTAPNDPAGPAVVADNRRRQELALRLHLGGSSFEDIATTPDPTRAGKTLYGNRGSAYRAVQTALDRHSGSRENAEQIELHHQRYEALLRAHWSKALEGNGWATDRVLKIMEQLERLLGLVVERKRIEVLSADVVRRAIEQLTTENTLLEAEMVAFTAAGELGA